MSRTVLVPSCFSVDLGLSRGEVSQLCNVSVTERGLVLYHFRGKKAVCSKRLRWVTWRGFVPVRCRVHEPRGVYMYEEWSHVWKIGKNAKSKRGWEVWHKGSTSSQPTSPLSLLSRLWTLRAPFSVYYQPLVVRVWLINNAHSHASCYGYKGNKDCMHPLCSAKLLLLNRSCSPSRHNPPPLKIQE